VRPVTTLAPPWEKAKLLVVDVAVGIAILGLLTLGAGYLAALRKKQKAKDPHAQGAVAREKGALNVQRMEVADAMRCTMCGKATNPEVDLYTNKVWWHRACYRSVIT
jgi:hypothetical protein